MTISLSPFLATLLAATVVEPGPASSKLSPCPDSPNCVSSLETSESQWMAPLVYELTDDELHTALRNALESMPRTRIVRDEPSYLHAEVRSLLFGFVDDVELEIDSEHRRVHFRSASRTGYSDLGANRRRMETLCTALVALDGIRFAELEAR